MTGPRDWEVNDLSLSFGPVPFQRSAIIPRQSMRRSTLLLSLLFGLFIAACSPEDPFTTEQCTRIAQHEGAFLRVVHAAPTAPPMNVFIGAATVFPTPQSYLNFQPGSNEAKYYPVPGGTQKISFKAAGVTVADTTVALASRGYYTAYLYGSGGSYHVLLTSDDPEGTPDGSHTRVRIVQLSPDAGAVRVIQEIGKDSAVMAARVPYGTASDYYLSNSYLTNGPAIRVYNADTWAQVYFVGPGFTFFPGGAVYTLLISGNSKPTVGDTTIFFTTLEESAKDAHCLHGQAPIPIKFGAIRLVNLIPTGVVKDPPEAMRQIDLSFFSTVNKDIYKTNDHYRRELSYSQDRAEEIYNLQTYTGDRTLPPHFFLPALSQFASSFPYQIELHMPSSSLEQKLYQYQPRLVRGPQPLSLLGNVWYTIVAYGPLDTSGTVDRTTVLNDNIPIVAGAATVRFFHGAYDTDDSKLQEKRLALRVKDTENQTGMVSYGEGISGGTGTIAVTPGPVTFQVVDESGNVVLEQDVTLPDAGFGYNVFLHRGATGDALRLDVAKQEFTFS
jgi:hypothetical protein